jgi:hypothetical protein
MLLETVCACGKRIHPRYQREGVCEDCLADYWFSHKIHGSCSFAGRALPLRKDAITSTEAAVYGDGPVKRRKPRCRPASGPGDER